MSKHQKELNEKQAEIDVLNNRVDSLYQEIERLKYGIPTKY